MMDSKPAASPAYLPEDGIVDQKGELGHYDGDADFVYVPDTDEERKLVRKIDMRLIPMLWVMYILNYVSTCP